MRKGEVARGSRTALVTGASSGIGKAIAERLAAYGYNLVIVSRDEEQLRSVAEQIEATYSVQVRHRSIDLGTQEAAYELYEWCKSENTEIDVLVNDAGMFIYNDTLKCDLNRIEHIMNLHMVTPTLLCRLFGDDMASRRRGYILNIASYSVWMNYPGLSLYSASKNYLRSFSKPFAGEMRTRGVKVTAVSPAGVTTDLYGLPDKYKKLGHNIGVLASPEKIARVSLRAMFRGRRHIVPGIMNRAAIPLLVILPDFVIRLARRLTMRLQK